MRDDKKNLFIIDFGLSYFYDQSNIGKSRGFIGTPRYASLAAHKGKYQNSEDDI